MMKEAVDQSFFYVGATLVNAYLLKKRPVAFPVFALPGAVFGHSTGILATRILDRKVSVLELGAERSSNYKVSLGFALLASLLVIH